eukprot:CAMPEP_0116546788 /NCGR_PEP_ID=MMETSP0397-20121206/3415_1 /TAXON_ID=216820 /ORGANISM="Cyclophora tenuis, Strain ECT3854" /LENGTH=339 /DNA_ID=CAMNT_0004071245 /DNA_START=53 /DNA_END=1073 /DNA_ORIENTATION=-
MAAMMVPTSMKAIVVREQYVEDHPVPVPKEGFVLVKNKFAGLNFIDTYFRSGLYKKPLPFVSGQEGGGEVVATSSDAVKVGDIVAYMAMGSYAEYTLVPVDKLVKVPNGMTLEIAIAAMTQGLTGHYLAMSAHANLIQPGQWCLIYSVASGTNKWTAQLAKQLGGYKVIGTCSKSKNYDEMKKVCDELIVLDTVEGQSYSDYTSVDMVSRIMDITDGVGCHAIMDGIGKATADTSLQVLAQRGIWITFGNASGPVPDLSPLKLSPKSAFLTRPKLGDYIATRDELEQRWNQLSQWILDNQDTQNIAQIDIDHKFPLKDAQEGHLYIEGGHTNGKVLFEV